MSGTWCDVCDGAGVWAPDATRPGSQRLVWRATAANLLGHLGAGRMTYVKSDVPVEDMAALTASDLKYTVVAFLLCEVCTRQRFAGLSVRGAPVYRVAPAGEAEQWEWEPVPDEALWKGDRAR